MTPKRRRYPDPGIKFARDELMTAASSVGEALEALRDRELPAGVGADSVRAELLLTWMNDALRESGDELTMSLSRDEAHALSRSISVAAEALPDWEYPIRMGAEKDEARDLGAAIDAVLRQAAAD